MYKSLGASKDIKREYFNSRKTHSYNMHIPIYIISHTHNIIAEYIYVCIPTAQ